MNTISQPRPVTPAEILAHCAMLQANLEQQHAAHYPNLTPPKVYPDKGGRKYVRIVREETMCSGRSVIHFVEKTTGSIWKADGWKGPEKNVSRGNILPA